MKTPLLALLSAGWLAAILSLPASAQETQRQYLSGHDKDDAVPWKFMCTSGPQSGYWTNLVVPSQWEMHGFGSLNYHKDPTNAWNEQGLYEHDFTVPADWNGKRIFLVFEGVMTDTSAKLNGQSVGPTHQGGFYQFRYEVTGLVRSTSTNELEVTVAKHSANNSINHAERTADYWVFGGIYRPVYLEAVPPQFIQHVAIDARADGNFALEVACNGSSESNIIEAQILQLDGQTAGEAFTERISGTNATLKSHLNSPRTWTAETPNLYQVEVRLKQGDQVIHRIRQRFGFRTMEVRDGDGLYVNGQRVILKGACRHSFWPESGRCLSETVHRLDINTMKDMNMNAVRMSHYPPDQQFLDLCDELGLYVLDELAGWHAFYDNEVGPKLVREMVTRDVNHPSILFWDNGNEGGWNTNLDGLFAQYDPQQRRVLHPWRPFSGVNTSHYLAYDMAAIACQGIATYYRSGKEFADTNDPTKYIYMPTEFMHGLFDGGAGAGLEDYWAMMSRSKYLGGGFIWVLEDDGVKRPDTGQIDVVGNQAPDGIVGPYRQREASFYTIKKVWSPIVVLPQAQPGKNFTIVNQYNFLNANQCTFTWQLRFFPRPGALETNFAVSAEGKVAVPSIPPGATNEITLALGRDWLRADALALRVDDPTGRQINTWVWPLPGADRIRLNLAAVSGRKVVAHDSPDEITVNTGDLEVRFSKQTGLLDGVKRGDQIFLLTNGPRPANGQATLKSLDQKISGSDCVITEKFDGDMNDVIWRIRGNGWVQCDYSYTANGPMDFHGVAFDYPEPLVKGKKWLGDGPYRVWKNRLPGPSLNVWENTYNNTITGWSNWIYPEFKGCFANVHWLELETAEGPILAVPATNCPYVQVLAPQFPPTNIFGFTGVNLPKSGLAFLQAIPPMGSKFKEAKFSGPLGQTNIATGQYSSSVSFYFWPALPIAKNINPDNYRRALILSSATAARITNPFTTCCQNGETFSKNNPLFSTPIIRQPSTVPSTVPRPPESDVPPITTAAMESSSYPRPALGCAPESSRAVTIKPATAASAPPSAYT